MVFLIKKKGSMRLDERERERKKHNFIKEGKKQLNSERKEEKCQTMERKRGKKKENERRVKNWDRKG